MIITCNNCNKKFDIDSSLISDKGRLLQCANCDYKWFFKKEVLENTVNPIDEDISIDSINIFDQNNPSNKEEINQPDLSEEEAVVGIEEELNEKIEINNKEESKKNIEAKPKKQKKFKILNIFIVAIISFVAFIIIVDTFKYPIGKIVPNVEFILYNLYESIKDISLFIRDLT
ncbi:zinc-ribbon domain-containing protein [Candidatus Pelagibacter sp.]|nr:zinc-ribbon domain-containing protein [Candidatus Pelagibacter sp.]